METSLLSSTVQQVRRELQVPLVLFQPDDAAAAAVPTVKTRSIRRILQTTMQEMDLEMVRVITLVRSANSIFVISLVAAKYTERHPT